MGLISDKQEILEAWQSLTVPERIFYSTVFAVAVLSFTQIADSIYSFRGFMSHLVNWYYELTEPIRQILLKYIPFNFNRKEFDLIVLYTLLASSLTRSWWIVRQSLVKKSKNMIADVKVGLEKYNQEDIFEDVIIGGLEVKTQTKSYIDFDFVARMVEERQKSVERSIDIGLAAHIFVITIVFSLVVYLHYRMRLDVGLVMHPFVEATLWICVPLFLFLWAKRLDGQGQKELALTNSAVQTLKERKYKPSLKEYDHILPMLRNKFILQHFHRFKVRYFKFTSYSILAIYFFTAVIAAVSEGFTRPLSG